MTVAEEHAQTLTGQCIESCHFSICLITSFFKVYSLFLTDFFKLLTNYNVYIVFGSAIDIICLYFKCLYHCICYPVLLCK